MKIQLKAQDDCKYCHGSGSNVTMTGDCDCAIKALSNEEYSKISSDIDDGNYEIIPSDLWNNIGKMEIFEGRPIGNNHFYHDFLRSQSNQHGA